MRGLLALSIALVACGGDPAGAGDLGGPDLAPAFVTPTFGGQITLPVRAQLSWRGAPGEGPIEGIEIADGRGALGWEGTTVPALVSERIPFGEYTLAQLVATTPTDVIVAYAYCRGDVLDSLYFESLRYTVTPQQMATAGRCGFVEDPITAPVWFVPPRQPLELIAEDHADVDGARLRIHGGRGTFTIAGVPYPLTVFTGVDCDAARCGGAGWYELHSVLERDGLLAFVILYLENGNADSVKTAYGFRFDAPAAWPPDETLPATWTRR